MYKHIPLKPSSCNIIKKNKYKQAQRQAAAARPIPAQKIWGNPVTGAVFSHTMTKMDFLLFSSF